MSATSFGASQPPTRSQPIESNRHFIAVDADGPLEDGGDGVVKYMTAHFDGVESEKVVRSPHSCQSNPQTIDEVRRILRVHAAEVACTPQVPAAADASGGAVRP